MKKRKKIIILLVSILIIIITLIIYIFLRFDFSKLEDIKIIRSQAEQEIINTLENSNPTEITKDIADKEIDGILYKNIHFYKEGEMAVFIAEAYNVAKEMNDIEQKEIVFLNRDGQEVGNIFILIDPIKIGDSTLAYGQSDEINYELSTICDFIVK